MHNNISIMSMLFVKVTTVRRAAAALLLLLLPLASRGGPGWWWWGHQHEGGSPWLLLLLPSTIGVATAATAAPLHGQWRRWWVRGRGGTVRRRRVILLASHMR